MNIIAVKKAIRDYIYTILNTQYPTYFKEQDYTQPNTPTKTAKNVYWASTMTYRPLDATECILDVISNNSFTWGIEGEIFKVEGTGTLDDKYYYEEKERRILTVNILVTSMKNEKLGLTDLTAQNLALDACTHISNRLKSGSALNYFYYDNTIFTPIEVLTGSEDLTDVDDVSYFEDTQNRHTCQFSCKFRYNETGSREVQLAQGAHVRFDELGEVLDILFDPED